MWAACHLLDPDKVTEQPDTTIMMFDIWRTMTKKPQRGGNKRRERVTIEYGTRGYTQENVVAYAEKFIRWMLGFNHWTGQGLWFLMRFIWQNWWFVVMRSRTFKIEIQRFSCFFCLIVADLLKGKWDGKYIYARTRNWCNRKVTVQELKIQILVGIHVQCLLAP